MGAGAADQRRPVRAYLRAAACRRRALAAVLRARRPHGQGRALHPWKPRSPLRLPRERRAPHGGRHRRRSRRRLSRTAGRARAPRAVPARERRHELSRRDARRRHVPARPLHQPARRELRLADARPPVLAAGGVAAPRPALGDRLRGAAGAAAGAHVRDGEPPAGRPRTAELRALARRRRRLDARADQGHEAGQRPRGGAAAARLGRRASRAPGPSRRAGARGDHGGLREPRRPARRRVLRAHARAAERRAVDGRGGALAPAQLRQLDVGPAPARPPAVPRHELARHRAAGAGRRDRARRAARRHERARPQRDGAGAAGRAAAAAATRAAARGSRRCARRSRPRGGSRSRSPRRSRP